MKSVVLSLLFLTCILQTTVGQSLEIKLNPNLSKTNYNEEYGLGFGSGIFYDQTLYKRLGFSTGLLFTQLNLYYYSVICFDQIGFECPIKYDTRYNILEIPFDLTLKLLPGDSKWDLLLRSGYSYGYLFKNIGISYYENKISRQEIENENKHLHFFNVGAELRHPAGNKMMMSLGTQYQYTKPDQDTYILLHNYQIYFKAGFRLNKENK